MVPVLFLVTISLAFLSSDAAARLGLESLRMACLMACVAALALAALAKSSGLSRHGRTAPVIMLLLLSALLARDALGTLDPLDYKILLPLLLLLAAPEITRGLGRAEPASLAYWLLAGYVAGTFLLAIGAGPLSLRGYDQLLRWDFAGSLIGHSGLCVIASVGAFACLRRTRDDRMRLLHLLVLLMAASMILLTATRTALVTLALVALLDLLASRSPVRSLRRLAVAGALLAVAVALHTLFVSDVLWARLLGSEQADWSSGRWGSQLHWLTLAADHPMGMGLGAVRELLRGGRPALDGVRLLEWPHNELIRFWVEGGPLGFAFVLLLLSWLTRRALLAARHETDQLRRAMQLAIPADMIAQSLLQNYLNGIYHATAMILLLAVITEPRATASRDPSGPTAPQALPELSR